MKHFEQPQRLQGEPMRRDHFRCLDARTLLDWILYDFKKGELFGIDQNLFFLPHATDPFRMERYGQILETPLGVAAGPHSQLAQNILTAWVCGARYIELKTVQILDELHVTKPCIDMMDEGYNCEWSQELKLDQSYEEYLKAFVLLYVLRDLLRLPPETVRGKGPGFLFNMSVGYSLEGILSPAVQLFFDRMEHCAAAVEQLKDELAPLYPRIRYLPIPGVMSNNLTLSTMHGCPPEEVEKIGLYCLAERHYHTTIKLNPTLLGPDRLRMILNEQMGYPVHVPDEAFAHDLKYDDGLTLIKNLSLAAKRHHVCFSLKLTNTLETCNKEQRLPKNEAIVYMSGRALHPISIHLAAQLQEDFEGDLDITFSAGLDAFNIAEVFSCGLKPLTVCSDLLKPGGYGRMRQYLECLQGAMMSAHALSPEAFIRSKAPDEDKPALANLRKYAVELLDVSSRYRKETFFCRPIKISRPLPRFDCAKAPCMTACPAGQAIPRYLEATARGDFEQAWKIILASNPFPNVLGMVCNRQCQKTCTRFNYDRPLMIREIKRFIAHQFRERGTGLSPAPACGRKVAVLGAGPSGLSCAHFLALRGVEVHLYETKAYPGGMAADAIPSFRLDKNNLARDIEAIVTLGVHLHTNTHVDAAHFEALRQKNDAIYVAVGARESLSLGIPGEHAEGVTDHLSFLGAVGRGENVKLGQRTLVIGGGNAALDAARTAKRLLGVSGEVTLVYRRTRKEMPADREEIQDALDEGIRLDELVAPEKILVTDGKVSGLRVCRMRLKKDAQQDRAYPVREKGQFHTLEADSIIVAIGQQVSENFLSEPGPIKIDPTTCQTSLPAVFAGGDVVRGASSLVQAIEDGRKAAEAILASWGIPTAFTVLAQPAVFGVQSEADLHTLRLRQVKREMGPGIRVTPVAGRNNFNPIVPLLDLEMAKQESRRCLQCDLVCNICATVCPNRANLALRTIPMVYPVQRASLKDGKVNIETLFSGYMSQPYQVVNLPDICNECGNCATFCPTSGAPYRDKPRVYRNKKAFERERDGYYLMNISCLQAHMAGNKATLSLEQSGYIFEDTRLTACLDPVTLEAQSVIFKTAVVETSLAPAVEMAILHQLLRVHPLFNDASVFPFQSADFKA